MTSRSEIQQTLLDCKYYHICTPSVIMVKLMSRGRATDQFARNGFEKAHSWKSDLGQQFLKVRAYGLI